MRKREEAPEHDTAEELRLTRRDLKLVAAFWALSLLVLAAGLTFAIAQNYRNANKQDRARVQANYDSLFQQALGGRRVALISCQAQNVHRAIERRILERGLRNAKTLLKGGTLTSGQIAIIRRQNVQAIHDLAARKCSKDVDKIPFPKPPPGVRLRKPPDGSK